MILTLILLASSLWQINKRMEYYLTNRFYVVCASVQWYDRWIADDIKIWQDQKLAREPQAIVSLMVFPLFEVFCVIYYWTNVRQHGIYVVN